MCPGPGSTTGPACFGRVATGTHPASPRGKRTETRPTPELSDEDALPATNAPVELTEARNVTAGAPGAPGGPGAPVSACLVVRARSWTLIAPSRIARDLTAPVLSLPDPTALGLICRSPTLLRGSVIAAYEVPPTAMNMAADAMALAYVARLQSQRITAS